MLIETSIQVELKVCIDVFIEPGQNGCRDSMGAEEEPSFTASWDIDTLIICSNKVKGSRIELDFNSLSKLEQEEITAAVEEELNAVKDKANEP